MSCQFCKSNATAYCGGTIRSPYLTSCGKNWLIHCYTFVISLSGETHRHTCYHSFLISPTMCCHMRWIGSIFWVMRWCRYVPVGIIIESHPTLLPPQIKKMHHHTNVCFQSCNVVHAGTWHQVIMMQQATKSLNMFKVDLLMLLPAIHRHCCTATGDDI